MKRGAKRPAKHASRRGVIERARIGELLRELGKRSVVYAPVSLRDPEPVVDLAVVAGPGVGPAAADGLTLEYANTRHSVKRLFFPQTELMFRFDHETVVATAEGAEKPRIIAFGVRPCDAMAVTYLDKIFAPGLTSFGDPAYLERRGRSVIVAFACSSPCRSCFCTAVGGGPAGTAGADVLLTALGEGRLLAEGVTERGATFLEECGEFLADASEAEAAEAADVHRAAEQAVPALATADGRVDRDAVKARMDASFDDPIWNRLTESCIGCGACTYLCPTCHCFDIADEQHHERGRRIRTWDSCQYALFTKHASGHNPRPARKHRLRQRFMHKFSYTVEKSGDVYCVGCGRCVTQCPVNLDIREVIRAFSAPGA